MLTKRQKKSRVTYPSEVNSSNISVLPLSLNLVISLFPKDSSPCVHSAYMVVTSNWIVLGEMDVCLYLSQDDLLHSESIIAF